MAMLPRMAHSSLLALQLFMHWRKFGSVGGDIDLHRSGGALSSLHRRYGKGVIFSAKKENIDEVSYIWHWIENFWIAGLLGCWVASQMLGAATRYLPF